ncbi:MAG: hypothetical protein R3C15_19690 [Thermoleophilia bacterium]
MQAGDYVELRGYQNSGGSLNVSGNQPYGASFWIALLGDYPAS